MRIISSHLKLKVVMVILVFLVALIFIFPINHLLTKKELNTLISEKGITPISTYDIGYLYTDIIYKDVKSNEMLQLLAYKNRWGKIKTKQYAFYRPNRINKVEVEYWGPNPYSYYLDGYVGIEILSKDILDEAKSAEVTFNNGFVVRAIFQDSNILLLHAKRNFIWEKPMLQTIEIFNDEGNVIHGFYTSYDFFPNR